MEEVLDTTRAVLVRFAGDRIDSILVRPGWRESYPDAEGFCEALNQLILDALPPVEGLQPVAAPAWTATPEPMTKAQFDGFWAELALWDRGVAKIIDRTAPSAPPRRREPISDPRGRTLISFDRTGRFEGIGIRPETYDTATPQTLSELLTGALGGIELSWHTAPDPLWDDVIDHRHRAERYLRG